MENLKNDIDLLPSAQPWPDEIPDFKSYDHGWFDENRAETLDQFLNENTKLVFELGSWLGKSTRHILKKAPNAVVVSIDHWEGSEEHLNGPYSDLLPTLYERFLVNCWEFRDRLIPLKTTTDIGLRELSDFEPDLIYIDASHEYMDVISDITTSIMLFPKATIVGDDWTWKSVRKAVVLCSETFNKEIKTNGPTWHFIDKPHNQDCQSGKL